MNKYFLLTMTLISLSAFSAAIANTAPVVDCKASEYYKHHGAFQKNDIVLKPQDVLGEQTVALSEVGKVDQNVLFQAVYEPTAMSLTVSITDTVAKKSVSTKVKVVNPVGATASVALNMPPLLYFSLQCKVTP